MSKKPPTHRGNDRLKRNANKLRRTLTGPERRLWSLLRSRQLDGLKFRRQQVIGPYIVDYFCAGQKLIVEVDGQSHVGRAAVDDKRTAFLETAGLRVLRVTNDNVLRNSESVLRAILLAVGREA